MDEAVMAKARSPRPSTVANVVVRVNHRRRRRRAWGDRPSHRTRQLGPSTPARRSGSARARHRRCWTAPPTRPSSWSRRRPATGRRRRCSSGRTQTSGTSCGSTSIVSTTSRCTCCATSPRRWAPPARSTPPPSSCCGAGAGRSTSSSCPPWELPCGSTDRSSWCSTTSMWSSRPTAQRCIDGLAAYLPAGSQMALVGRTLPPGSLSERRMAGATFELGPADLAMSDDEAEQLFARAGLRPRPGRGCGTGERTEGWPGGLHLAALALQRRTRRWPSGAAHRSRPARHRLPDRRGARPTIPTTSCSSCCDRRSSSG